APEAVASRTTAANNSSMTLWAVLHCIDSGPGFVRRVDVGNLHAPGAPIQERGDNFGLVPDRAHDRRYAAQLGGGDARLGVVDRDGARFVCEQDPVEAEVSEHLHHARRGEGAHDAERSLPGVEALLERVFAHDRLPPLELLPAASPNYSPHKKKTSHTYKPRSKRRSERAPDRREPLTWLVLG